MATVEERVRVIVALVPWAETSWSALGRLAGRTPLPLSDNGRNQAKTWGDRFARLDVGAVFSSDEQTGSETARIVTEACASRQKVIAGLSELDLGLWEGLTADELARRYPKAFKLFRTDLRGICPPEGEDPKDAVARLMDAISAVLEKHQDAVSAVVLGPFAMRILRAGLEERAPGKIDFPLNDEPFLLELVRADDEGGFKLLSESEMVADPDSSPRNAPTG